MAKLRSVTSWSSPVVHSRWRSSTMRGRTLRVVVSSFFSSGVVSGGVVRVRTATASAVLTVVADDSLPRQVVAADFNVPLDEGTVADLIDASTPVVELRMETP